LSNNRDVVNTLANGQNLSQTEAKYFVIVKDEIMQMLDMITLYREITASTMEIYMSSVSNNLNHIMKRLTAGASLVLVPTFITGLYGMNFQILPEIYWRYGYLFAWFLIIGSFAGLWIYFRKRGYL
jgi:magnesium transporter